MSRILRDKGKYIPLVLNHVQQIQREAKTQNMQEIVDITQLVILECALLIAAVAGREKGAALMTRIGEHILDPNTRLPDFEQTFVSDGNVHESNGTVN